MKRAFNPRAALETADAILAFPGVGTLPRVEGAGICVARFALPLELCLAPNRNSHGRAWSHKKHKDRIWACMRAQHPRIRQVALQGRPMVRCVRFSSVEPDVCSEGFKTPIDFLCLPKQVGKRFKRGLGFLVDDAPKLVERVAFWEYAKPGAGLALLEVWTGRA